MRCPQCQFENIPGQDRCLRCNAILQATAFVGPINPPRMAQWKKPIRATARWFRLRRVLPQGYPKWLAFLRIMSGNALLSLILSIIPGFAHLVSGRFREIILFFLAWLLALSVGIFLYGSNLGFLLLGIAVGLHCWISYQHTLLKEHEEFNRKIFDFLLLLTLVGMFYFGIRRIVFSDFVFGYTNLTIPGQNVKFSDLLLGRNSAVKPDQLRRGCLALVPVRQSGGGDFLRIGSFIAGNMVGQVIGLPGDTVEIRDNNFIVNDEVLPHDKFPLPEWLRGRKFSNINVPDDAYFISNEYNVRGNAALVESFVKNVCIVKSTDIEARAIMLWFPLDRRGFLKEDQ